MQRILVLRLMTNSRVRIEQDADIEWYIKGGNLVWPPGAPTVTMSVIAV